jgi:malic enzyme
VSSRSDLAAFQTPFAQDRAPVATFVEAVKELRPTGIIGVSTAPEPFTHEVIQAMATINQRPIISRIRIRPRAPNARPKRPIAGGTGCRWRTRRGPRTRNFDNVQNLSHFRE